ncbi:sugar phosphate isomerase/epimerase [Gracilibacillus sp. YIM 98692]|uniref:sugar phosphate isomerase/epimerase family protein n=1 Tax=Gracilibacillus sp. YIM 98692 TaxID=2663532 RepID=UPI0013D5A902|nr:sugar phosphate isomerase/epimerase [Gracilibacillus sp. YIM 98692]
MRGKFAVQLYTLRKELDKDLPQVLKNLKEMGWSGVQLAGYHGYHPKELAALLKELGLFVAGIPVDIERMQNDLTSVLNEADLFNTKDLFLPYIPEEKRNEENYIAIRKVLNEAALKIRNKGYRISYHNHDFEFDTWINSKSALEFMLEPTQNNEVLAQIDVYWVKKAGRDPLEFIKPYANRMPIIHLKDMAADNQDFAALGTGIIDFEPIISWGEANGIEWYVVEQDECPGDPIDSLQISLDYLNQLNKQHNG